VNIYHSVQVLRMRGRHHDETEGDQNGGPHEISSRTAA